jgi:iron complex transport system substrate-binding protein
VAQPKLELSPILPVTISDYAGQAVTISSIERIVSLDDTVTEIVWELGLAENLVAIPALVRELETDLDGANVFGPPQELMAAQLLAFAPTVIIGNADQLPPEVVAEVQAAGIPLALTRDPALLDAPMQKVNFVARAVGLPERGRLFATEVARRMVGELVDPPANPLRVLVVQRDAAGVPQLVGSETLADVLITAAGARNAAEGVGLVGSEPLQATTVSALQPDVILVFEQDLEAFGGSAGVLALPGIASTPAGQAQRIIVRDAATFFAMGPQTHRTIAALARELAP